MSTLAHAVERLAGAGSAGEIADIVRSAARVLSGADGIAVVLREGDKVRYVDEDAVGPLWKGGLFPMQSCISGWTILNRRQVVIPDVFADPRIPHELYRPTFVRSCVMTPVGAPEPIACIGAYWATVREPTRRELDSLEAVARATAVALQNLRLQRQLREALSLAEASNRAKSDFLTHMSHEIRTPLNGVVGALALLDSAVPGPDRAKLLDLLRSSGADLEAVLQEVLDYARLQSATVATEIAPFQLGDTVREVERQFEARFAEKGLGFRALVEPDADRWALGDRGALKQVLINLVDNALKFTASGCAILSVGAGDLGEVRFEVADTGVGISPEAQERIFGGFERADASPTRPAGGMGLGLAIARRLVELMAGQLTLKSRPGAGSLFTITVPMPTAPAPATESGHVAAPALVPGAALRVLVVDDHPTNRLIASALLGGIGAEVVEAGDGAQACAAFEQAPFDAVLMDIQMPVMDGLDATRRIRRLEQVRGAGRTPIIMLSANALPEHVQASRAAGANRHLAKPISPALLFAALQEAVGGRALAA